MLGVGVAAVASDGAAAEVEDATTDAGTSFAVLSAATTDTDFAAAGLGCVGGVAGRATTAAAGVDDDAAAAGCCAPSVDFAASVVDCFCGVSGDDGCFPSTMYRASVAGAAAAAPFSLARLAAGLACGGSVLAAFAGVGVGVGVAAVCCSSLTIWSAAGFDNDSDCFGGASPAAAAAFSVVAAVLVSFAGATFDGGAAGCAGSTFTGVEVGVDACCCCCSCLIVWSAAGFAGGADCFGASAAAVVAAAAFAVVAGVPFSFDGVAFVGGGTAVVL